MERRTELECYRKAELETVVSVDGNVRVDRLPVPAFGVAHQVTAGGHAPALIAEGQHDFDNFDGLVSDDQVKGKCRNVQVKSAFVIFGLVADAAGTVTQHQAHVQALGGLGQHVLEKVAKAVLQADTDEVEFLEFAYGGEPHAAKHQTGMVETSGQLQVGVGENAQVVEGLVTVNGGVVVQGVAMVAKDGRDTCSVFREGAVVAPDGDNGEGESRFEGHALGNRSAHVPVAVQHRGEVGDDGLHIARTVEYPSISTRAIFKSGDGLVDGGVALVVHGVRHSRQAQSCNQK